MLLGLRTAIYRAPNIDETRDWYKRILGIEPYFDEPFYVGFNVGGYELGLDPDAVIAKPGAGSVVVYWGVASADVAMAMLLEMGATEYSAVRDVGDGIKIASVLDPFGNVLGIIENSHFKLA